MTIATRAIRVSEPLLSWLLAGIRRVETLLGPSDDWVEQDRRWLYELADRVLRPLGRPTIHEATSSDHVVLVDSSPDAVEDVLSENGYQRNLLSTRKYRTHHDGGRQWAVGSWVRELDDERQHHVYLFPYHEGGTDVYAHSEPSVTDPSEHHMADDIQHGDPAGLRTVFDTAGFRRVTVDWQ